MAVSKKRKKAGKVVRRQPVVRPQPKLEFPDKWELKVKASQVHFLKSDPDFLLMIQIGRMLNAITFAMSTHAMFVRLDTNAGRRQTRRGLFVMAGYIHESVHIIKGVGDRHNTMESFVPLRKIAYHHDYKKARDYAREIRNVTAFHIAESEQHANTQRSLDDLELGAYTLMGGDNKGPETFYFELADYLDFALIGRTFQNDRTPRETADDIQETIRNVAYELMSGGHTFMIALARKMELGEYVYGQFYNKDSDS